MLQLIGYLPAISFSALLITRLSLSSLSVILVSGTQDSLSAVRMETAKSDDGGKVPTERSTEYRMDLSGLHPSAVGYVEEFSSKNRESLEKLCASNPSSLRIIEQCLAAHGLPAELKYLAIVESRLSQKVVSPMGAAGPWQLMPRTARAMGLRVENGIDERLDTRKSTEAAIAVLKHSQEKFGDWLITIAAFNAGSGRMASALKQSRGKDFWSIEGLLPKETRQHVRKYIATLYCMEGRGGITTGLSPQEATPSYTIQLGETESLDITGKYHSQIVSKALGIDALQFDDLNPDFNKYVGSVGYRMRLPIEKMQVFVSSRLQILDASIRYLMDPGTFEMDRVASEIRLPPVRLK